MAVFIGLGHSVLAMSGEESLAQVYREIEHPKLPNLKKAALVIFIYSMVFTSLVSFFAVMIIPDTTRPQYFENLIGGLAMSLTGPFVARLAFHIFVVVVGTLILSGAVNTAIVGSNGVLNRVSEDGVLSDWFRQPHPKFGTSYRIINIVVVLQIVTILISRGDVTFLANLYAFGVIWSFALKGIAVLVLRYTHPQEREFRVPLNFQIARQGNSGGLALITLMLLAIARGEPVHQARGHGFGHDFLGGCSSSDSSYRRKTFSGSARQRARGARPIQSGAGSRTDAGKRGREARQYSCAGEHLLRAVSAGSGVAAARTEEKRKSWCCTCACCGAALGRVRSGARSAFQHHRTIAVHQSSLDRGKGRQTGAARGGRGERSVGRHSADGGESAIEHDRGGEFVEDSSVTEQAREIGMAWERMPEPRPRVTLEIFTPSGQEQIFYLGPHAPRLTPKEIDLLHKIWLELATDCRARKFITTTSFISR